MCGESKEKKLLTRNLNDRNNKIQKWNSRKTKSRIQYNKSVVTVQLAYFLSTDDKVNVVNWEQIFTVYIPNWE